MKTHIAYFGIDVSKSKLHLASPEKFLREFDNDVAGHATLAKFLTDRQPVCIVMEASGGYERMACEALHDAGLPVAVVQPSCVKNFAKSIKVLAKTDKIDAQVIARFAEATRPQPTPKTSEIIRKFRALCDRRAQVVEDRVREANRLRTCADAEMREHLEANLARLQAMESELDRRIAAATKSDPELTRKLQVMTQQKGVGAKTAHALLAHFPELGTLSRQQVAALAGIAPHPRESGTWKGKRRIYGGRGQVRKALYMAAKSAAQWCPVISKFYQRLKANGKSYNANLIACARKMLVRLNTILKETIIPSETNQTQTA